MRLTIPGVLCGTHDNAYDFTGEDGRQVVGRTSHVYLATTANEPPGKLIVPTRDSGAEDVAAVEAFDKLLGNGGILHLKPVSCVVDVDMKGKFTFRSIEAAK